MDLSEVSPNSPALAERVAILAAAELLAGLDPSILARLAAELTSAQLPAGHCLLRQGDPGDCMYVVVRGRLRVVLEQGEKAQQFLREIGPGESIGEIALLTGQTRTATVYASDASEVLQLAKSSFDQLVASVPEMAHQLQQALTEHIRRRQLRTVLRTHSLFRQLDDALLRDLEAELTWLSLDSGETLLRQGDPGDCMYLIVSGRLRVVLQQPGQSERVLRELGRGESLGEIALLTGQQRTATVYAIRDSEVARLSKASFDRLLGKYPHALTQTFTQSIINIIRAHESSARADSSNSLSVVLLPLTPDLPLGDFAQRLAQAFTPLGATLHLNSKRVDSFLGKPGIAQDTPDHWNALDVQLVGWLSEQESEYRYLIYEADPTPTAWTQRCLRQADHILLVAQATSKPDPTSLLALTTAAQPGAAQPAIHKQTSLILLQRDGQQLPSGTQRWLARHPTTPHYHIRWQQPGDFARVARIVAGRAVGLVLGGGGARGAAHIGVLQALEEAGVPIDIVGGTSAGAVLGTLYAMGNSVQQLIQSFKQLATNSFMDFTLPVVALTAGGSQNASYKRLFGNVALEELRLPCFCVSTNLTRAEVVIQRTGLVWQAVRASSGVPGVYPPVVHNGELLVDGGLLNNLPIDIMRRECGNGTVIAVDVTPPVDLAVTAPYGETLSGWQAMWEQLTPRPVQGGMPNIMALLYRAGEVGSVHAMKTQLGAQAADLYLRPPVEQFGLFDAGAIEKIAEIGYRFAQTQLAHWQGLSRMPNRA